jgi:5-methylcytosine-specific restriction endonuclease McrA
MKFVNSVQPVKPASGAISSRRFSVSMARNRLGTQIGWKCFYCSGQGDEENGPDGRGWHVDHAYPVIRGGDEQPDNLVLACATCNLAKKDATAAEFFTSRRTA